MVPGVAPESDIGNMETRISEIMLIVSVRTKFLTSSGFVLLHSALSASQRQPMDQQFSIPAVSYRYFCRRFSQSVVLDHISI